MKAKKIFIKRIVLIGVVWSVEQLKINYTESVGLIELIMVDSSKTLNEGHRLLRSATMQITGYSSFEFQDTTAWQQRDAHSN